MKELMQLLEAGDPAFWTTWSRAVEAASGFSDVIRLGTLRRRALARLDRPDRLGLKVALIGGCTLHQLGDLSTTMLGARGWNVELLVGEFDNYVSEALTVGGPLDAFVPDVVVLLPSLARCRYPGALSDARSMQQEAVVRQAEELHSLCRALHERTGAEILLGNFPLPATFDPGALRARSLGSDWSFRKAVNLELGLSAPAYVTILDLEFLACRMGNEAALDDKSWFESKQPFSTAMMVTVARELAHLVSGLKRPSHKVLALDLDNTMWGGVIGDDGVDGIEIGTTSPRGEAFRAFQDHIAALKARGVLLGVCSKNDMARAMEGIDSHPEMVLRSTDFVSIKANWNPKADNLREMAEELGLGLDSFLFVDDNPAEIEMVQQFAPAVSTLLLGPDPSTYRRQLQDCRLFEPRTITAEDEMRTRQYLQESERRRASASFVDMDSYLRSLEMEAVVAPFAAADVPRIAQLINKSNQFNLTTVRRTEAEVRALCGDSDRECFTIRLRDRFGDHGLIAVVVTRRDDRCLEVDTWLMSCRVLKRQVEEETLNEIVRIARRVGVPGVRGRYVPTAKNGMVADLYPRLGFGLVAMDGQAHVFEQALDKLAEAKTWIRVVRELA